LRGSSSPFWRLIPIKLVYDPDQQDVRLSLIVSAFINQLRQGTSLRDSKANVNLVSESSELWRYINLSIIIIIIIIINTQNSE